MRRQVSTLQVVVYPFRTHLKRKAVTLSRRAILRVLTISPIFTVRGSVVSNVIDFSRTRILCSNSSGSTVDDVKDEEDVQGDAEGAPVGRTFVQGDSIGTPVGTTFVQGDTEGASVGTTFLNPVLQN